MPSRYLLRIQADERTGMSGDAVLELARRTGADEVVLFFAHMELFAGHESLDAISAWLDASRQWRNALRDNGIAVSMNPPHTIGHADWGRRATRPWQRLVDQHGRTAQVQVCPLDPDWQAYYARVLARYAAEDFDVVWIEDDIRLHNHDPLDWGGCFCPLHLADFADRTGVDATRDEVVAACLASGEPHPWRQRWLDAWQESLLTVVATWRPITAANGTRLGLMSSRLVRHAAEGRRWDRWLAAFDVHRPHFWDYDDVDATQLPLSIVELDAQRALQPAGLASYPEIESWPYWRWHKSYRQTTAQTMLAHVLGSDGLALSLYDFPANLPDDDPTRAEFLARARPALDLVADLFPKSLHSTGIAVPWSPDASRRVRLTDATNWRDLEVPAFQWAPWLASCGHAVTARDGPVTALAGQSAWGHTDDQLRRWLTGGVLLDGIAARILAERGFGEFVGLTDVHVLAADQVVSLEVGTDPEFAVRTGVRMSLDHDAYRDGGLVQGSPAPAARVVSRLHDPRLRDVGHGLVLFENPLGGRVATVPWHLTGTPVLMSPHRAHQLGAVLDWLGGDHAVASGHPWLVTQALTDGARWRVVVWNASQDETTSITLRLPAGMPEPAAGWQLTAAGDRHPVTWSAGTVALPVPLGQWTCVVLCS